MIEEASWMDGWDWMGLGWMVIIGRRQSKNTFGANKYKRFATSFFAQLVYQGSVMTFYFKGLI